MNDNQIVFFKDSHTYWLGEKRIPSVGSWIKQFFPDFKEDFWLTHGVLKEYFGEEYSTHYSSFKKMVPDAAKLFTPFLTRIPTKDYIDLKSKLLQQWERKKYEYAFKGTKFHDTQEKLVYDQGFIKNPWDQLNYTVTKVDKYYDNESLTMDLYSLPDGAYPELVIFDLKLWLCGQADEVYIQTIKGKRYIDINDHKTNEKKPSKSSPEYCQAPFEDEYASKDFMYSLQINIYAHMLKRCGFIPRNLGYTHYKDYNFTQSSLNNVRNLQDKIEHTFSSDISC